MLLVALLPATSLRAGVGDDAAVKERVEPLLTTRWGQDAPYNGRCPEKTNAQGEPQHCRVGCVACAMAQVLNFHEHPAVGTGTGTNMFNTALTVNYGEARYAWDAMLDSYGNGYTEAEADAVATLMFHCGVAVNMIYGLESSSTFTAFANNMTTALSRYFGYDASTLRSLNRSQYTKDEWLQVIREELSAGRPVIYSGNSPSMGGHTWVVDGYDAEGRLHMNWGWLGRSNGYYDADLNVPGLDFSQKQSVVIGIRPVDDTETAVHSVSGGARDAGSEFYDLTGRRVGGTGAALRPGIYVSGGRKLIIH